MALTVTVCIASFEVIGELQRERLHHHMLQRLAGMDERVDNSCKQRTEYLRRSLVIVCRERSQWQASFIREKSVCLVEVSVSEQILREFPKLSMCKQCVPGSFLPPPG